MPRIPIHDLGTGGIIVDTPNHLLPPEVWSNGQNVRFIDGNVERITGHSEVFDPPTVAPEFAISVPTASTVWWVYFSLLHAYAYNADTHTQITPAAGATTFNTSNGRDWNGGLLGGVLVVTNEADDPHYWPTISAGTDLAPLANWPANTKCKIIRPFRNFLMALHITESGTIYPHRVKWSHSADPGTVPNSWDETDPTKDAGETDLSDVNSGVILDGLQLRDTFVIYKNNSTWLCRFIGGQFIFQFQNVLTTSGILASRCVAAIQNGRGHFVHNGNELVFFDGQSPVSLLDKRWHRFLENDIDSVNYVNSFCFNNPSENEAWFCYPQDGATYPNIALIWNYQDNTFTVREFVGNHAATGTVEELSVETWAAAVGSWDTDMDPWGSNLIRQVIISDRTNTKLYQLDIGNTFNATSFTAYVERTGLAVVGKNRRGQPKVDIGTRKIARRIWPKVSSGPVNVRVGSQEDLGGDITWGPIQTFDYSQGDRYLDYNVNGRLLAVRFEDVPGIDAVWKLEGYDLEVEVLGEH